MPASGPHRSLRALLLAVGAVVVAAPAAAAAPRPARNLLIITLDTTRADHLSAYGGREAKTPVLERLAREGTRFEYAFAAAPVTLPSHASLFTGLYPTAHGIRNNGNFRLEAGALTLAEALRAQRFTNGAVIGSQVLDSRYGLDQGFDDYDDQLPPEERVKTLFTERTATEVADRGIDWLRQRGEERWFLWLHFFDPHFEYRPPEPFKTEYAGHPYDGEIAYADREVGRVLEALRELGQLDTTLVVVTSDHGEGLGDHGESSHGLFVYDATMRVPLLLRHPGSVPAGRVVAPLVRLIDVFPTALDLLALPPAAPGIHGVTLRPLLEGKQDPPRQAWLESWLPRLNYGWSELTGVREASWKYIRAPRSELYAVASDRQEARNVIETEAQRAESMRAALAKLEREITPGGKPLATAQEPDDATRRALESLGYVATGKGTLGDSAGADPKDEVGEFERIMEAIGKVARQDWGGAIPALRDLVRDHPRSAYLRTHLGNALRKSGKGPEAIAELKLSLEVDPTDFGTLTDLGNAYFEAGDLDEAAVYFRRVLAANSHMAVAYHNLGLIEQRRGRDAEAVKLYRQALVENPDLVRTLINLGTLLEKQGQADEAATLYLRAADLDPANLRAFLSAAFLRFQQGNDAEVLRILDLAEAAHPASALPPLYRARVHRRRGDLAAAERDARTALARDPSSAEAQKVLADIEAQDKSKPR